jgi:DNA-binding response OmpR family regulator
MLTAIGATVNELTSPLYGADDYVDKPFDFNELSFKIRKVLRDKRAAHGG